MTQNEKDILLKDLSARLPYGVKGLVTFNGAASMTQPHVEDRTIDGLLYDRFAKLQESWYDNVTIKPYLFPLSSMTAEQRKEYEDALTYHDYVKGGWTIVKSFDDEYIIPYWFVDFCNKNHLDYRGLIPKGLANDATNLNIY